MSRREDDLYARVRARQRQRRGELDRTEPATGEEWAAADDNEPTVRALAAPQVVGDLIGDLARRRGWQERLRGAALVDRWPEVVGPELARRCAPVRLAGGTLVIEADTQVWATQLRYVAARIQERVEAVLGPGTVREVRITVGRGR